MSRRVRLLVWLGLLMLMAWALRAPFLSRQLWNLDEGVTLTIAEQVWHGDILYRDATDHRGPMVPYLKAAIYAVAGGWNAHAVHVTLALALGACAFALWRLARRLGDETTGIAAALVFTALSFLMLDKTDALSANNGWFIVIFSTFGFAAFAWGLAPLGLARALPAGVLFGCSFLCKQPGLLDFGVTWVLLGLLAIESPERRPAYLKFWFGLMAGAAIPVLVCVAYFAAHGAFGDLVYYAFTYNTQVYVPAVQSTQRLAAMADPFLLVWRGSHALAVLGAAGAIGLLFHAAYAAKPRSGRFPVLTWLILGWSAAGVLSTGLSGRHFSHYSAQAVPGFSLACGWTIARCIDWARKSPRISVRWAAPVFAIALLASVAFDYRHRARALELNEGLTPEIGRLVQEFSAKRERIFVWGYYPEIYFFSHRLPATRFIYANFVTGLIPWTNLDPLIDTAQSAVPDSTAQLHADWQRHPPALVVDTGGNRGYIKYPLHAQVGMWDRIRAGYAQVNAAEAERLGIRLFRRLRALEPNPLPGNLRSNPGITVSGYRSYQRGEPPRLRVNAPAGTRRLELYAAGERIADLDHPETKPVDVLFFADLERPAGTDFRVVVTTAAGPTISESFDFGSYARAVRDEQLAGPELHLERFDVLPLSVDTLGGKPVPSPAMKGFWKITAPMELEYSFPVGLQSLDFVHGLEMEAWGHSDGYDLVLEHRDDDGRRTVLLRQRLHPQTSRPDRELQKKHLALAPLGPGRLVFRFLAGEHNNANFDWIYLGQIQGHSPGPMLRMHDQPVLPDVAVTRGNSAMRENDPGVWAAHTPARIEWKRPTGLRAIAFQFGIEEAAVSKPGGHSDGVGVSVEVVEANGKAQRVFSRLLEPFNHPDQRGAQDAAVTLPPEAAGQRLVLSFDPGPKGDASWDWAWLSDVATRETGPAIGLSNGRQLAADTGREMGQSPARYLPEDRWGAHADAELVYRVPENLADVTFRYGLLAGADRDENGNRRSDGVDISVVFARPAGPPRELFRRNLDPFSRSNDSGEQTSTVTLPKGESGHLIFKLTSGPSGNHAYDWGYWGRFNGTIGP